MTIPRFRFRSLPLPASGLVGLLLGCAGGDAGAGPSEPLRWDSAGVEIVTSAGRDAPLAWSLDPLFALGGEDEGPGSFFRVDASGVGGDGEGRIHVLDYQASRVVVYGPEGELLRTIGQRGEGPGELTAPNALAVSLDGEISVFDFAKGALVRFSADGEVLPQRRLERTPVQDGSRRIGAGPAGVLVSHAGRNADGGRLATRLTLLDGEGDEADLASFEGPLPRMVMYERCGGGLSLPPVFAPAIVWDARDTRVASNAVPEYRIDIHEDGRLIRSLRREVPILETDRELAEADLGEGLTVRFGPGAEPCLITPPELVDGRGFDPVVQRIRGIAVGPDGGLWVTRRSREGRELVDRVDVFGPDGAYRGTLPAGTPAPLLLLPGDRVAYPERDALDVERLVVARIVESP